MEESGQEIELPPFALEQTIGGDSGGPDVECHSEKPLPEAKKRLEAKCLDPTPVPSPGE